MEEVALQINLDLIYFWKLNPRQFNTHLSVFGEQVKSKFKELDEIAHLMGMYVLYAFNDPSKYPELPFYSENKIEANNFMSDEEMEKIARRNTIIMGGEIRDD